MASEETTTTGVMVSRAISKVPTDPRELATFLQKILTHHYKDIANLYAQCTDNDLTEKKRRDNMQA